MPARSTSRQWLGGLLLLAAALRFFPIWFGLPHPYARPDEAVSISRAMGILGGDLNPHFFHWPSLTFYVTAAAFAVASFAGRVMSGDPALSRDVAVIIARVVVAAAGTATLVPLFRLARRMADVPTALAAAAFLAAATLHVRDSHFALTDVLMTFFVTAALARLISAYDDGVGAAAVEGIASRGFAAAGVLAGLAAATKYNAAIVVVSMAATHVLLAARFGRQPWVPSTWRPPAAFGLGFVAAFIAATPFAILDYATFAADVRYDFAHLSGGHGVDVGRGWSYHLARSLPYGCGLLIFAASLFGAAVAVRRYPRHTFIVGAFALVFYMALGSGQTVFFRYVMPLVPVVCLFAAVGARAIAAWVAARTRIGEAAVTIVVSTIVALPALTNSVWMDVLLARRDTRVLAAEWLAPRLRAEDTLHDAGGDYSRLDLASRRYHEWRFDPGTGLFGNPQAVAPDWLVLSESPLHHYASAPAALRRLALARYDLVWSVRGPKDVADSRAVYDVQDAFFMPLSGFQTIERPGPTISIYRRRD